MTRGYVGDVDQPFHDGWLATGDLGRLTEAHALVIEGRKKDLLKTSYGKYVRASRIEAMLREIPGVDEAMVVGEGRPFCAALLWVDETNRDEASQAVLDAAVVELNRDLSHPEQLKRWAVLKDSLSVASGELTPNLKLRRPVVLRRFAREVDALYEDVSTADGVPRRRRPSGGSDRVNLRLMLLRLHIPASVRRAILRDLIAATARAFERDLPDTARLTEPELMARAIECSRAWAEEAIRTGADLDRLDRRMFSRGVRTRAACASTPPRLVRSRRPGGGPDRLRRHRDRLPPSRDAGGLDTEVRLRVRVRAPTSAG